MLDTRQVVSDDLGKKEWPEETELAFRQLSFKEMTFRRFMRHPIAKWAALTMAIIVVACYGAPIWHLLFPHFIQAPDEYDPSSAGTGPRCNIFSALTHSTDTTSSAWSCTAAGCP